jgi:hypothetical protein
MRIAPSPAVLTAAASLVLLITNAAPLFAPPTDVQLPGTQSLQAVLMPGVPNCEGCHGHYDQAVEPAENWTGSMMAHAGRDPLFWAALAIAEGDYPGAGDFCIRCHSPRGWHEGRAVVTDGSQLNPTYDHNGIECGICHNMVNPNTQEHAGVQSAPYLAHDGATPPNGFYGSGMMVLAGNQTRYGPYANTTAGHAFAQSLLHRSPDLCGTCHDVSNPVVGDLAHNNGAQVPLAPGRFSGVPNSPVTGKAAFLNFPHQYGVVERTYSEHKASALDTTRVRDYLTLPSDLQRGALRRARDQALLAGNLGDYEDGTTRYFSCQSCHMEPVVGEGAAFGIAPLRYDLPLHDLTGGNTWVPDLIRWLDGQGRLRLGSGITAVQSAAMDRGILRARGMLQRAGALDITGNSLRVTNLTGHKLITGYPEGRRMWLRMRWKNEAGTVLREDGRYGALSATHLGQPVTVNTILDPNARVYETKLGLTQQWATQLLGLGVNPNLPLSYDRTTGAVTMTLIQLASLPPGSTHESFHFVLNNTILSDNRIPPYGLDRNEAQARNALPVPATQFGNPAPGSTYRHWDDVALYPPAGASRAEIELLYQTASWEYIQFLHLTNPGTSPFLATAGFDVYDGWRNTGMSAPETMAKARWCRLPGTGEDLALSTGVNGTPPDNTCGKRADAGDVVTFRVASPGGTFTASIGALVFQLHTEPAPPTPLLPGIWLNRVDGQVNLFGLPPAGVTTQLAIPPGISGLLIRTQAIMLSASAANGIYAASDAHDVWLP